MASRKSFRISLKNALIASGSKLICFASFRLPSPSTDIPGILVACTHSLSDASPTRTLRKARTLASVELRNLGIVEIGVDNDCRADRMIRSTNTKIERHRGHSLARFTAGHANHRRGITISQQVDL